MKASPQDADLYPQIISSIIRACGYESYLELGISHGSCLRHLVPACPGTMVTAVDMKPSPGYEKGIPPDRVTWAVGCTTDAFFASNEDTFDAVFIDADHSSHQVILDFEHSLGCLNPDGIIFLHDTYPPDESYTRPDRCSDSYRAYLALCGRQDLEVVTLPAFCGLTIVRPVNPNRRLLTLPEASQ